MAASSTLRRRGARSPRAPLTARHRGGRGERDGVHLVPSEPVAERRDLPGGGGHRPVCLDRGQLGARREEPGHRLRPALGRTREEHAPAAHVRREDPRERVALGLARNEVRLAHGAGEPLGRRGSDRRELAAARAPRHRAPSARMRATVRSTPVALVKTAHSNRSSARSAASSGAGSAGSAKAIDGTSRTSAPSARRRAESASSPPFPRVTTTVRWSRLATPGRPSAWAPRGPESCPRTRGGSRPRPSRAAPPRARRRAGARRRPARCARRG